jgi:hypothetical protein
MIAAIEKSASVRCDVSKIRRLDNFINSPVVAVKTKEANKKINEMKKAKNEDPERPDGKRGGPKRSISNTTNAGSTATMTDEANLLDGCACLPDVGDDPDQGDGSTFDTAEMEVDDALSDDGEDGDAWSDEESHDEMLSDDMERSE